MLSHKKNRERNDLVDIWRIFNPSEKRYSWRQKSPAMHCRLDFFFIISVGAILQEKHILVMDFKHILVMDLKKITLFCHFR